MEGGIASPDLFDWAGGAVGPPRGTERPACRLAAVPRRLQEAIACEQNRRGPRARSLMLSSDTCLYASSVQLNHITEPISTRESALPDL